MAIFARTLALPKSRHSDAHKVGNNEKPVSQMRGPHVRSGAREPDRIVPMTGKVSEDAVQSVPSEVCDVLHDDVSRSNDANDPGVLAPKTASSTIEAKLIAVEIPAAGKVLAREPSADDFDGVESSAHGSDIFVPPSGRPMLRQHGAAVRVDLHLPLDWAKPGPLKATLEPADAAEQGSDGQHHSPAFSRSSASMTRSRAHVEGGISSPSAIALSAAYSSSVRLRVSSLDRRAGVGFGG